MDHKVLMAHINESFKERGSALYRKLYDNKIQKREEAEEGDISLCRHFGRLFNWDPALMDAAYRTSARFNPAVWEQRELLSGRTYGARVVESAIGGIPERWKFLRGRDGRQPFDGADFNFR